MTLHKYLHKNIWPKENFSANATTIKNNIDDLSKLKVQIDELNAKVTEDDNALFDSNGRHISEVQTDSQGDVIDRVVGSTLRSLSDKSTPKTDFIPEPRAETLLPSKYGRKRVRVERDDSTPVNNLD